MVMQQPKKISNKYIYVLSSRGPHILKSGPATLVQRIAKRQKLDQPSVEELLNQWIGVYDFFTFSSSLYKKFIVWIFFSKKQISTSENSYIFAYKTLKKSSLLHDSSQDQKWEK